MNTRGSQKPGSVWAKTDTQQHGRGPNALKDSDQPLVQRFNLYKFLVVLLATREHYGRGARNCLAGFRCKSPI
jgi:hypothetical protein